MIDKTYHYDPVFQALNRAEKPRRSEETPVDEVPAGGTVSGEEVSRWLDRRILGEARRELNLSAAELRALLAHDGGSRVAFGFAVRHFYEAASMALSVITRKVERATLRFHPSVLIGVIACAIQGCSCDKRDRRECSNGSLWCDCTRCHREETT